MKNEEQINRITRMEENLDDSRAAIDRLAVVIEKMETASDGMPMIVGRSAAGELAAALEEFEGAQSRFEELAAYYDGGLWRADYEDDEAGRIPEDLKRGVLSQDAVYDLITEYSELIERMRALARERTEPK